MLDLVKQHIMELITATIAVIGPIITYFFTKQEERKKAKKEIESIRVSNDAMEEKYRGNMLETNSKLFNSITKLQEELYSLTIEQTKLRSNQVLLEERIEKLKTENKLLKQENDVFKLKLDQLQKEHDAYKYTNKELLGKNKILKEENSQLKLKLNK